jgi:signal transduction histidine kinase
MPQRFEEVNMNHLLKEAMYFLESQCSKENIDVVYHLAAKLPRIVADPIQLNQVIVNLVVNSIQAMPEGGKLTLSTFNLSDSVILTVEDTGKGIAEDIMQDIFKPFFSTKELNKGTGLGLSVVHGIVTTHKGQIKVESDKNKGTKFEIKFSVKNNLNAKQEP